MDDELTLEEKVAIALDSFIPKKVEVLRCGKCKAILRTGHTTVTVYEGKHVHLCSPCQQAQEKALDRYRTMRLNSLNSHKAKPVLEVSDGKIEDDIADLEKRFCV